jgi:hypothetical protein
MAIEEHDREDLLRDGRAMPLRGETTIDDATVVVGFRAGGQMSLYCGADPVYQFNADGELRRVFFHGQRYSAENGRLVLLERAAKGGRVQFCSQPINEELHAGIFSDLKTWLAKISEQHPDQWTVADANGECFSSQLQSAIQKTGAQPKVAAQPNQ